MGKEIENIYGQFNTKVNWKILLNKFDSRTILSTDYISQLLKDPSFSSKLFKSIVRTSQEFPNMKKKRKQFLTHLENQLQKKILML
ncbi:hypothetical protein AVI50_16855 (plasmid) [Piscirickettsia salmonis]|nr:hypothetical protein AVI50_16855 [Piscirickettsia salmonis]